jgi:hypothetical protein
VLSTKLLSQKRAAKGRFIARYRGTREFAFAIYKDHGGAGTLFFCCARLAKLQGFCGEGNAVR